MDEQSKVNGGMDKDTKSAVGTGVGAATGAAAGAAIGTIIPGVGNVVGAVIGGAVGLAGGAVAGKAIADHIDPKVEDDYWRDNYNSRTYASDSTYEDFGPAYRYGWETRARYPQERRFDDVESELSSDWDRNRGESKLTWERAKHASRDAWHRIEEKLPGDADRDGR